MSEFDEKEKRLVVKIVYYGPALSGKTTNLMRLHDLLAPGGRGDLMSFETKGDRTLFFDLLPLLIKAPGGFKIKLKLFTVPGQVAHDATRKTVLSRADGVVFVADSRRDQTMSNYASFENLEQNAARVGLDFDHLPLVIQFNKRDLPDIIDEAELIERWTPTGLPIIFGSAIKGVGVAETFAKVLMATYRHLDQIHGLAEKYGVTSDCFDDWISGSGHGP